MKQKDKEPKRPSHAIWQVIGDDDKARWNRIGSAWRNEDGKGFNLNFDAYPAVGRVVLREVKANADKGGQQ